MYQEKGRSKGWCRERL